MRDWRGAQVIGSGGTFTNLAGIYLMRQGVQTARTTHGTRLPRVELEHILDMLQDMSPDQRAAVPGLNPARADIIVAGFAVAAEVLARLESRELIVSAYGIREGLAARDSARRPDVLRSRRGARAVGARVRGAMSLRGAACATRSAAVRCSCSTRSARASVLPATDRQILADAALLHDVGYHINYENHHKHSYHLIVHADMLGMSPEEQVAIANVARYHRGAPPKRKHPNYGMLDRGLRRRIRKLAAILRVADGFDRGHIGAVDRVKVRWLDRALRLTAVANRRAQSLRLDLWGASRKSELLAKVARIPVEIVAPDGTVVTPQDADEQPAD